MKHLVPLLLFVVSVVPAWAQRGDDWIESHGIRGHRLTEVLSRNEVIWVGTEVGGLFWSSGGEFVPSRQGVPVGRVTGLEMDSRGVIYAGIDEKSYRSSDAGRSWQQIAGIDGGMVDIAEAGSYLFLSAGGRLYRATINGGAFERLVDVLLAESSISLLESSDSVLLVGGTISVLRSTDFGERWSRILVDDPVKFPFQVGVGALAVTPAGITAAVIRLYLSEDNGLSYAELPNETVPQIHEMIGDGNRLVAAMESGVSASTDGGRTFSALLVTEDDPVLDVATDGEKLVAITAGDVFVSSNRGIDWTRRTPVIEAAGVSTVRSMGDDHVFALSDGILYRSTDAGKNFTRVAPDSSTIRLRELQIGYGGLFALSGPSTILRSNDMGTTWSDISGPIADSAFPIALLHVSGPNIIAATHFHGIFRSSDNGATWSLMQDDSAERILDNPTAFASWIPEEIYLATRNYLLRSTDGGMTWNAGERNGGLDRSIVALGIDNNLMYAATSQAVYARNASDEEWRLFGELPGVRSLVVSAWSVFAGTGRNGVWRSFHTFDGPGSFEHISDLLVGPASDINALAISLNRLVAATSMNVWTTYVDLGDGVPADPGLPDEIVARYDGDNGSIDLSLSMPLPAETTIELVDLRGNIVTHLFAGRIEGAVRKQFPVDRLPAGSYFLHLRTGRGSATVRVPIVR